MLEWLKRCAWKAHIRKNVSGVRIPLSPQNKTYKILIFYLVGFFYARKNAPKMHQNSAPTHSYGRFLPTHPYFLSLYATYIIRYLPDSTKCAVYFFCHFRLKKCTKKGTTFVVPF